LIIPFALHVPFEDSASGSRGNGVALVHLQTELGDGA
jgi:hypothetical protein